MDGLGNFLIFRLKKMFELLVLDFNEFLGADDAGICEIAGAVF